MSMMEKSLLFNQEEGRALTPDFSQIELRVMADMAKKSKGLRKLKARAMVEATKTGRYEKGNHIIKFIEGNFMFYYRGTLIYKWDTVRDAHEEIPAGKFNETPSTRNQRKEIRLAIQNFKEVFNV